MALLDRLKRKGPPPVEQKSVPKMESTSLVQGCSIFAASPLNVGECQQHLCRLLRAIFEGEKFTSGDTETIFFTMTQAFNNKDLLLHRLIFLALRYLKISPDSAIMVTQALSKDISGDMMMNRARAVRLLPHILQTDHVMSMERFIKQIVISRDAMLSCSGLSCALTLCMKGAGEMVKKWVSEIHTASSMVSTRSSDAQYLALLVLYFLRRGDGSMLRKMADQRKDIVSMGTLGSHVMIQVCDEANKLTGSTSSEACIVSKLKSSNAVTQIDAARAILSNEKSSAEAVSAAVTKLNSLLSAPANVTVYAALRTIAMYAPTRREEFSKCNTALERALSQADGSMSALAAMSLLHTGFESTIDRVLPSISSFATKLTVPQQAAMLRSCVEVARRHPAKLDSVLTFIWNTFRSVDEFQVQKILVDGFFYFAQNLPTSSASVFKYLCEYLEDSKFSELSVQIVNFIGKVGVQQENRSELIRCLCNRLSLEGSEMRAATIDALYSFAKDPQWGEAVRKVIRNHLNDGDDEVRDRATLYTEIIDNSLEDLLEVETPQIEALAEAMSGSAKVLEEALPQKKVNPLEKFGECENKSVRIKATEDDADIVVSYVTKLFSNAIVFDFKVKNTLPTAIINVSVSMVEQNGELEAAEVIPAQRIEPNEESHVYVTFAREQSAPMFGIFSSVVVFYPEDDPDSEENFELDVGVDLKISAYMKPTSINNFDMSFAQMTCDRTESVKLGKMRTVDDVIRFFVESTGLEVASKEETVDSRKRKLTLVKLAGLLLGKELVLVLIEIAPALRIGGFPVRITVKSGTEDTTEAVMNSLLE